MAVRRALPYLILAVVLAAIAAHAGAPVTTNDVYWHIKTGEHLWQGGELFPTQDPFSYTASERPWFLHEWLTQLLFYGTWSAGGLWAIRLLTAGLALAIATAVWRTWRRELASPAWGLVGIGVFLLLGVERLQARPTLFTILATVGLVSWLARQEARWNGARAATLVLVALAWINLHSVGLLVVPLYAAHVAGEGTKLWLRRKGSALHPHVDASHVLRHCLTLLAVVAATCATPSGVDLWGFAFQDKSAVMEFVADEWAPFHLQWSDNEALTYEAWLTIHGALATLLAVYLAVGAALTGVRDKLRAPWLPDPSRMALLLLCTAIGLSARRFHWMLCLSLVLGLGQLRNMVALGALPSLANPVGRRIAFATAWAMAALSIPLAYHRGLSYQGTALHRAVARTGYYTAESCAFFELGAVDFLRAAEVEGSIFCHYGSGGILSYHLYPRIRVFIDSRIDLYGREIYLDYLAASVGHPQQRAILETSATDLYYRHWDMVGLTDTTGWVEIYRGDDGELWLRDLPRNDENFERIADHWRARHVAWSRSSGFAAAKPQ